MPDETDDESLLEQLEENGELEELTDKVQRKMENRDRERVQASLGMFSLEVESHSSLDATVNAFEDIWKNRVAEIEGSRANTLREKLEDDEVTLF